MLEFLALAQECAPTVAPQTMAAVVRVESSFNPFAIGVVGGRLARQPTNAAEAIATANQLHSEGWNFSLGIAQVNRHNLPKFGIGYAEAFDACTSLRVGSKILEECFTRAAKTGLQDQAALHAAFSCYYSGNFTRGFKQDFAGQPSYVQKVLASAAAPAQAIPVVPSVASKKAVKPQFDKALSTSTPVTLQAVPAAAPAPVLPIADHAPVLLRAAPAMATTPAPGHGESVTSQPEAPPPAQAAPALPPTFVF